MICRCCSIERPRFEPLLRIRTAHPRSNGTSVVTRRQRFVWSSQTGISGCDAFAATRQSAKLDLVGAPCASETNKYYIMSWCFEHVGIGFGV